jgi:Mg2+/citrate symporter
MEFIVSIAASLGVAIGLLIHFKRQAKMNESILEKVHAVLASGAIKTLPELVLAAGMKDGFLSRGKMMNALNPLVASGELVQEEPAGTTMANRLSVLTFRSKLLSNLNF